MLFRPCGVSHIVTYVPQSNCFSDTAKYIKLYLSVTLFDTRTCYPSMIVTSLFHGVMFGVDLQISGCGLKILWGLVHFPYRAKMWQSSVKLCELFSLRLMCNISYGTCMLHKLTHTKMES